MERRADAGAKPRASVASRQTEGDRGRGENQTEKWEKDEGRFHVTEAHAGTPALRNLCLCDLLGNGCLCQAHEEAHPYC